MTRYERNFPAFSREDFKIIRNSKICVAGCGGLGGYIIEMLARMGVGSLILVDGDIFDETNLNRQLYSTEKNLGTSKAKAAAARVKLINKSVKVETVQEFLTEENGSKIVSDANVVMDALDNIPVRLVLQNICHNKGIPLIHGAIGGWFGQVITVMPDDECLSRLYKNEKEYNTKALGNPSFTPALVASMQVSECLKVLTGNGEILKSRLFHIDLLSNETFTFNI